MKKGFTLIELLIVVVMVGALVAIGLPKYQRAVERGRALEGISNTRYVAEYIYTKKLVSDRSRQEISDDAVKDVVKSKYFTGPTFADNYQTIKFTRNGGGWDYWFSANIRANIEVVCHDNDGETCDELGLTDLE